MYVIFVIFTVCHLYICVLICIFRLANIITHDGGDRGGGGGVHADFVTHGGGGNC